MSNLEKAEENTFQKIKKVDDKNIDIMLDKEFLPIGLDLSGSFFDWKKEESFKKILRALTLTLAEKLKS